MLFSYSRQKENSTPFFDFFTLLVCLFLFYSFIFTCVCIIMMASSPYILYSLLREQRLHWCFGHASAMMGASVVGPVAAAMVDAGTETETSHTGTTSLGTWPTTFRRLSRTKSKLFHLYPRFLAGTGACVVTAIISSRGGVAGNQPWT